MLVILVAFIIAYCMLTICSDGDYLNDTGIPALIIATLLLAATLWTHMAALDKPSYTKDEYFAEDKILVRKTKICHPAEYDIDFCKTIAITSIPLQDIKFEED